MTLKSSILLLALGLASVEALNPRAPESAAFLRVKGGKYDVNGYTRDGNTLFNNVTGKPYDVGVEVLDNLTGLEEQIIAGGGGVSGDDDDDDDNDEEESESESQFDFLQCNFSASCVAPFIPSNDTYCYDNTCDNCCIFDEAFSCNAQRPLFCSEKENGSILSPWGTCSIDHQGLPNCDNCCVIPAEPILPKCADSPYLCQAPFISSGEVNCTSLDNCFNCCEIDPAYNCENTTQAEACDGLVGVTVSLTGTCRVSYGVDGIPIPDCSSCCVPFGAPPNFESCAQVQGSCQPPFKPSAEENCTDESCSNCCQLSEDFVCFYNPQDVCYTGNSLISGICTVTSDGVADCSNCCTMSPLYPNATCSEAAACELPFIPSDNAICVVDEFGTIDCDGCCEIAPTFLCALNSGYCEEGHMWSKSGTCGVDKYTSEPDCSNCCIVEPEWWEDALETETATAFADNDTQNPYWLQPNSEFDLILCNLIPQITAATNFSFGFTCGNEFLYNNLPCHPTLPTENIYCSESYCCTPRVVMG